MQPVGCYAEVAWLHSVVSMDQSSLGRKQWAAIYREVAWLHSVVSMDQSSLGRNQCLTGTQEAGLLCRGVLITQCSFHGSISPHWDARSWLAMQRWLHPYITAENSLHRNEDVKASSLYVLIQWVATTVEPRLSRHLRPKHPLLSVRILSE